jgi:ACT domain-containing protein
MLLLNETFKIGGENHCREEWTETIVTKTVLSVLGKDRKGIVATVAATLYKSGANIDDIAQTLLDDMFSMTMLVTVDEEACSFNDLQEALARDSEKLGMQITLQRADVFDFMYKI